MGKIRVRRIAAALICAAVLGGCRGGHGSDDANDQRRAQAGDRGAIAPTTASSKVALSGCVKEAADPDEFVLENIRLEPRQGDPHATSQVPQIGITEGAWVRLDAAGRNLKDYVGQRVIVKGEIEDDGRNTIGTSGADGLPSNTGERSQAAGEGHYSKRQRAEMGRIARNTISDGFAPEIRVEDVTPTGDRCAR